MSGAIAERARLEAYILYSFFMASWVYPILTHSIWSQSGWASMLRCACVNPPYAFTTLRNPRFLTVKEANRPFYDSTLSMCGGPERWIQCDQLRVGECPSCPHA